MSGISSYFAHNLPDAHHDVGKIKSNKKGKSRMEHLNRIELRGRVGTVRTNEVNGNKVANFSVVTEHLYKTREGNAVSETTWFNVAAWNNKDMPDLDRIEKGMALYVTGRMRSVRYNGADGTDKIFYEVLASKVRILDEDPPEPF